MSALLQCELRRLVDFLTSKLALFHLAKIHSVQLRESHGTEDTDTSCDIVFVIFI